MRTLKGLGALTLLVALLVGIPIALITLAGNPLPEWGALQQALTGIDFGGRVLMGTILPLIGWVAWASFAVSVLIELIAQVRNVRAPQITGLNAQQALAGALVAAVLAIGGGSPALAQTTPELNTATGPAGITQIVDTPAGEQSHTHTIQKGETLYGIAEAKLGDGQRYTELAERLEGVEQADGATMEDPNLIHEGWKVEIPARGSTVAPQVGASDAGTADPQDAAATEQQTAPAPAQDQEPQPAPAVAPAAQDARESKPATASAAGEQTRPSIPGASFSAPGAEQSGTTAAPAPEQEATEGADTIGWRTLGGIGSTLAASVLGLVALRRAAQRRRRKPGQQVPMPTGEDAQIEAQLKTVADQPSVDELDLVLRAVAAWATEEQVALPEMFCVRVTEEQIALYLAAPAETDLPAPFVREVEDGTVWTIQSGLIESLEQMPDAPYPGLVTVGKDDTGAQMLLDLELLGTLGLEGDPTLTAEVMDAMAVELATSTWGESLQVTLVGVADGLAAATGTGRVRHVDDLDELLRMLHGQAEDVQTTLERAGVSSLHEAKGTSLEQAWAPEIVLLGLTPTDAQADQLRELTQSIPRLGVAAVTSQNPLSAEWRLELVDQDNADLEPAGLHLVPQRITAEEASRIISVLATALADPKDAAGTGTQTVDLEAILGRPASHLTIVPDAAYDEPTTTHDPAEAEGPDELDQPPASTEAPAHEQAEALVEPEDPEEAEQESEPVPAAAPDESAETDEPSATTPSAEDAPSHLAAAEVPEQEQAEPAQEAEKVQAPAPVVEEQETTPAAVAHEKAQDHDTHEQSAEIETEAVPAATEPSVAAPASVSQLPAAAEDEATVDSKATSLLEKVTPEVPLVSLLGPMRIVGARGEAPMSEATGKVSAQKAERCVALAAWLALNPGASAEAYHGAFWPNAMPTGATASSNRNKLAAQTRKMLGQDDDGSLFFPRTSSEGYMLDERVTTDWQILLELIGEDPTTASTVALVAAMRLVRGAPFENAKTRNVAWADDLHQQMIETICDAAHELVHRALTAGHHGHAQLASRVGRTVDPANEAMWRDALTAEAAAGNREEVARLVEQLYSWLEDFEEGTEPEDETVELIDQLRERGYRVVA